MSEAKHIFRVVFHATSELRLMEKPGDEAARWRFNVNHEGGEVRIAVRDLVILENDVPWHRGLELQVDCPATDIDSAFQRSIGDAETVLIMLAAAGRAPVGSVEPVVAYDITPGLTERDFIQWYYNLPIIVGKSRVMTEGFGPSTRRFSFSGTGSPIRVSCGDCSSR